MRRARTTSNSKLSCVQTNAAGHDVPSGEATSSVACLLLEPSPINRRASLYDSARRPIFPVLLEVDVASRPLVHSDGRSRSRRVQRCGYKLCNSPPARTISDQPLRKSLQFRVSDQCFEDFSRYTSNSELSCIQTDAADHDESSDVPASSVTRPLFEPSPINRRASLYDSACPTSVPQISRDSRRIQSSRASRQTR